MLNDITEIYKAFLDGIKKESTTTVNPDRFNRLINTSQLLWQMVNIKDVEREQLDIDRFRVLLTNSIIDVENDVLFTIPTNYMRSLSVMFKVEYNSDSCYDGVSGFLPGNYMKTNNLSVSKINPYRKTNQNRIHYRQIGDKIEFLNNPHCSPLQCNLEYIRYANDMKFVSIGSVANINCELPISTRQEIVDIAIRMHLERVLDPRYKSYLNEYVINAQLK